MSAASANLMSITAATIADRRPALVEAARLAAGGGIGAGVVLAGFDPLNHASDTLGVDGRPALAFLLPSTLLMLAAVAAALAFPARRAVAVPPWIASGGVLLVLASLLSVAGSGAPAQSAGIAVTAVVAPVVTVVALARSRLSARWLLGGVLVATGLVCVRAGLVFLRDWGLPSTADLFTAKFQSVPYDFHYYTLGNPNGTAGWLLMPFVLAATWAAGARRWGRALLVLVAAVAAATLLLAYTRSAIAVAAAVLAVLAATAPPSRRVRLGAVAVVLLGAVVLGVANRGYLGDLFSTAPDASVPERVRSLGDGLVVLARHPVGGVGVGQYGEVNGYFPAHSSLVQAGAEMGVLGIAALTLLTGALAAFAVGSRGLAAPARAAAAAVGVYAVYAALAAPATSGLANGYVAVWAMTAAVLLAAAISRER